MTYNGQPLDAGEHYVVEVRERDKITVFQPNSADTTIAVSKGTGWAHARATAYQSDGTVITELPVIEEGHLVRFDYMSQMQNLKVGYVLVESSDQLSTVKDIPYKKQVQSINLALGTLASSTTNTSDEFKPMNVNDGDAFTYWESMPNRFPQSLTLDFGEAKTVSTIVLSLPPLKAWETRNEEIEVLTNNDGKQFVSLSNAQHYEFNPDYSNKVQFDLDQTIAQFIRLTFTANSGWPAAQLSEIEVYE